MLVRMVNKPGGGERFVLGLAAHLPDRFDVTLCTTREDPPEALRRELRDAGVRYTSIRRSRRFDLPALVRLVRMLRAGRFDVLHAHMFGANVWGTIAGRLARVPLVIAHEQTWSFEGRPLRRLLDRHLIARFADAFVAVSERDRDRMVAVERIDPRRITVMKNAYIPRPAAGGPDLRERLGLDPATLLVGTVCVLRPQKALEVLVDAFAQVAPRVPEAHLVIGGWGQLREQLERQVAALGLGDRVHFLGWVDNVRDVLRSVDVAAMSSDFEGTPLFGLECMAEGVPLVSTDVGGIRDVLDDGRSVLLVPRRDAPAMARALEGLLRDPARRAEVAAAAAERLPPYRIETVAAEFADLYDRLGECSRRTA